MQGKIGALPKGRNMEARPVRIIPLTPLYAGMETKTYTLQYMRAGLAEDYLFVREVVRSEIERVGKMLNHLGDKGYVWNISVTDSGLDVTSEFAAFNGEGK